MSFNRCISISPFTECCPVAQAQLLLIGRGDGMTATHINALQHALYRTATHTVNTYCNTHQRAATCTVSHCNTYCKHILQTQTGPHFNTVTSSAVAHWSGRWCGCDINALQYTLHRTETHTAHHIATH